MAQYIAVFGYPTGEQIDRIWDFLSSKVSTGCLSNWFYRPCPNEDIARKEYADQPRLLEAILSSMQQREDKNTPLFRAKIDRLESVSEIKQKAEEYRMKLVIYEQAA